MDNKLAIENINAQKALIGKFVLTSEITIFEYVEDIVKRDINKAKINLLKNMFNHVEIEKHINDGANTFNYQFSVDSFPLHDKIIVKCIFRIYR
jgi:hypothetical protein